MEEQEGNSGLGERNAAVGFVDSVKPTDDCTRVERPLQRLMRHGFIANRVFVLDRQKFSFPP